ncbi:plasmid mobilization protein [Chitinophaga rhizosphaerae]|uniref:plasmid mobilization protein n=1 Tax=Chitinophaga rhizosphaerae TaxID=1864947 RepID=UPI000F800B6C|nr:plasmid mobilization relaxosome protein MobC [Chitinophaga rhizosphaerae]
MCAKKGGRPPSPKKRQHQVGIRLNTEELAQLKEQAAKAGIKLMPFMRGIILRGKVIARLDEDGRQYRQALIGMANNINQMAKVCNATGYIDVCRGFYHTYQELASILKKLSSDK